MSLQAASQFLPRVSSVVDESDKPRVDFWFFLRAVVVPLAVTRFLLICVGCFALYRFPGARMIGWNLPTSSNLLNMWSHFDGMWYLSIAHYGYQLIPDAKCNVAFAPLYPMLMRLGGQLGGGSDTAYVVAGLIVSNAALMAAIAYMMALLLMDGHDKITAARAGWFVLLLPTSFFLSAVYPMSLFMALAAAGFYHARKQQWNVVGIIAGLAALSRPDGVLLTAGLAVEYFYQRGFSVRRDVLWLALGPAATLGWLVFQWRQFGDPLAFVTVQKQWSSCPLMTVVRSSHAGLQLGTPMLFAALAILAIRRLRPSHTAFFLIMFGLMLSSNRFWSITRFILVLFPAFMTLAILARRWRWVDVAYTFICAPLSAILMMRFALNLWVA